MRVAGIMSGTSLDGIDVAVIDVHKSKIETVAFQSTPYSSEVRKAILAATTPAEISRLNFQLGELYAEAVKGIGVPLKTIKLIGCHGQDDLSSGPAAGKYHADRRIGRDRGAPPESRSSTTSACVISRRGGQGAPAGPVRGLPCFSGTRSEREWR